MIRRRVHAVLKHPGVVPALVYLVGIAFRVAYTVEFHRPEKFVSSDMSFYVDLARRLLDQNGPVGPWDVTHPLGYPAFLALMLSHGGSLAQAGYGQLVVGCLVPGAVGLLGAAAFGRRTGLLALAVASLYFPFIEYGSLFLSEIHFTLWLALAFAGFLGAIGARRRAVSLALAAAGGLALSVAIAMKNVGLLAALAFFAVDGVALLLARPGDRSLGAGLAGAPSAVAAARGAGRGRCGTAAWPAGEDLHAREPGSFLRRGQQAGRGLSPRPLRPHREHRLESARWARLRVRKPRLGAPTLQWA